MVDSFPASALALTPKCHLPSSIRISLAVASASASHSHPAQITILAKGMIRAAARRKCKDIVEATLPRRWLLDRPVARSVRWLVGGFETGGIIIKYNTDFRRVWPLGQNLLHGGLAGSYRCRMVHVLW